MGKCRLYIADVDARFVSSVRDAITRRSDLELVGNSGNGQIALTEILRLSPDVVLSDIPLPGLDGIALLHETRRMRRPPAVVVCTRFYSQASMSCASKYGAALFLCKPVDLNSLPGLILECGIDAERSPIRTDTDGEDSSLSRRAAVARELLKRLGLSPKLDGSAYLLEAVLHCRDAMLMKNLSRGLYAELSRRMNTTPSRVERSLRGAIQIAHDRGMLAEHFTEKPTNRQFIAFLMREVDEIESEKG